MSCSTRNKKSIKNISCVHITAMGTTTRESHCLLKGTVLFFSHNSVLHLKLFSEFNDKNLLHTATLLLVTMISILYLIAPFLCSTKNLNYQQLVTTPGADTGGGFSGSMSQYFLHLLLVKMLKISLFCHD